MKRKVSVPVWAIATGVILLPVVGWFYANFLIDNFGICADKDEVSGRVSNAHVCPPFTDFLEQ